MINILFASFEATPFMKTGGLGDVAGSLPSAVRNKEYDIRVILPKLKAIPEEYTEKMKFVCSYPVPLGWRNQYCGLFKLRRGGVTYYFLDNEYYFHRDNVFGEFDDGERMAYFSKAVLETVQYIGKDFAPNIVHANDWHTALIPVFLKEHYRGTPIKGTDRTYDSIKSVFTIHNLKFQGQYDKFVTGDILGLNGSPAEGQMIHDDAVNFLQGGVIYADAVTTVSPTYAEEICTEEFGEGLEGLFMSRKYKLSGIINGIDTKTINPAKDSAIKYNYRSSDIGKADPELGVSKKTADKLALQKELGLPVNPDVPLFVMVSRLTTQKGVNLVVNMLSEMAERDMQFAVLGTGDKEYEDALKGMAGFCREKIAARIQFDEALSHRFYAGADVFLMPSLFEPCGLAQMMAMRYGTLPMVRETGGLKDTVDGYWDYGDAATGFSFKHFDTNALITSIDQAITLWYDEPKLWKKLQKNAMKKNFSWASSAEEYRKLYGRLAEE